VAGVLLLGARIPIGPIGPIGPVSPGDPVAPSPQAPPGFVRVEGGGVKIGTSAKDIEALVVANEPMANFLVAETPRDTLQVESFYLMVSEVTNEQFAAFVAATDWHPPYPWGGAAIEEGRKAWFEEDRLKREEAKAAGKRYVVGEKFDPERWWEDNWKDKEWAVPSDIADHPVTYVAYDDVVAYSRWAGVRPMTEFEFQCAGRGTTDNVYPWGKDWEPKNAAGLHAGRDKTWAIASFPDGARGGVYDLVGNVWEWTSSAYTEYKGYKVLGIKIKRGKYKDPITPIAPFDANMLVTVGGSVHMEPLGLRLSVRMPSQRAQRTNALGFRCASSLKPGRDLAEYLIGAAIPGTSMPVDVEYERETPTVLHRWTFEQPAATKSGVALPASEPAKAQASEPAGRPDRPPGYAIITGYDAMLFAPVTKIDAYDDKALKAAAIADPVHIGALFLTKPLVEPKLEPGAYMLAFREGGEPPKLAEDAELPAWRATPGLDLLKPSYLIYDATGAPIAAWPLKPGSAVGFDKLALGSAKLEPFVMPTRLKKDEPPPVPLDTVRFYVNVQSRNKGKAFKFDLPFLVAPGTVDASWHN
jgi:formylglycine-generating enzyme required for sulfatase activity